MEEQEIINKVKKIFIEEFEINEDELSDDALIYEDLGLDSLDSVDLVVALETEFKINVVRQTDEVKIRAIRTLKDIHAFVNDKNAEAKS